MSNYEIREVNGKMILAKRSDKKSIKETQLMLKGVLDNREYLTQIFNNSMHEIISIGKNYVKFADNIQNNEKQKILSISQANAENYDILKILKVINTSLSNYRRDYVNKGRNSTDTVLNSKIIKACYVVSTNIIPNVNQLRVYFNLVDDPARNESMEEILKLTNSLISESNKCIAITLQGE